MIKKTLVLLLLNILLVISVSPVLADTKGINDVCDPTTDTCPSGYSCQWYAPAAKSICDKTGGSGGGAGGVFGKITPPDALKDFVSGDPTGAGGISKFLSNLVNLIYTLAAVVLIFMLIWGAFEWITSEGDKEKIAAARGKIISAIIGIILFAVAFAVIQILGVFTGFSFFKG